MHTTNEEISSRAKETGSQVKPDTRWSTDARCESRSTGDKQKRISGEDSPRSNFVGDGCSITGGILRQLINEQSNQLASKNEQKKQLESEIVQIASNIKQFSSLLNELEADKKT